MPPSVIVDDTALVTGTNFIGSSWSRQTGQSSTYQSTLTVWSPGIQAPAPQLALFYYGGDITFYGTTSSNLAATYTIDGSTRTPLSPPAGVSSGKKGEPLFTLPNVSGNTSHAVNIFPTSGRLALDYVTYTPNEATPLNGLNLIVDDTDSSLSYSGQWNHTTGNFDEGRAYNGTISGTNIIGATMQVSFVGSDISVYGAVDTDADGHYSASFVVDGQAATSGIYTHIDDDSDSDSDNDSDDSNDSDDDDDDWILSQQLFHADLSPGMHTLVVTLTNVSQSQMLWIDSIVYRATSGTTILGIPSHPSSSTAGATTSTSSTSTSNAPSSPSSNPNPSPSPSPNSNTPTNSSNSDINNANGTSSQGQDNYFHHHMHTDGALPEGAVAGIIVGAFIIIFALLLCLGVQRRRRRAKAGLGHPQEPLPEHVEGERGGSMYIPPHAMLPPMTIFNPDPNNPYHDPYAPPPPHWRASRGLYAYPPWDPAAAAALAAAQYPAPEERPSPAEREAQARAASQIYTKWDAQGDVKGIAHVVNNSVDEGQAYYTYYDEKGIAVLRWGTATASEATASVGYLDGNVHGEHGVEEQTLQDALVPIQLTPAERAPTDNHHSRQGVHEGHANQGGGEEGDVIEVRERHAPIPPAYEHGVWREGS